MSLSYHLLSLVKPRIVALLCLTGASALFAAGGTPFTRVVGFVVAGALLAGAAAVLNCWYDRDIDRCMERTADRPLPSGDLSPRAALAFALSLLVAGTAVALATLPLGAIGYMWLGVGAYVGLYTMLLKRRSRLGVVLGGSAGSFPVLAGWATVRPLTLAALLMATLVFAWTPAHAWALAYVYRDDFAAVDVPTLPAVSSPERTAQVVWYAALATVAVAAAIDPFAGPIYAVSALVGSPCFLLDYRQYRRTRTERAAVRAFFTSNCYLAVLFLAWAVDGVFPTTSPIVPIGVGLLVPAIFGWMWANQPSLRGVEAAPVDWSGDRTGRLVATLARENVFGLVAIGVARIRGSVDRTENTR
jgi:protoheme IX farnesyltransferase